jgi:hypothetical protein
MLRVATSRITGVVLLLTWLLAVTAPVHAQPPKSNAHASAQVYLLTGWLGITSGLDGLAAKIKARGLPATMSGPGGWETLGHSAIESFRNGRLRAIVIIGYSTGGRSALQMAAQLNAAKVPVQLVIVIDGMSGPPVAPNVRKLINIYVPAGFGSAIARPNGFRGDLQNMPMKGERDGHFSIIAANEDRLLGYVLSAAGAGRPAASKSSKR